MFHVICVTDITKTQNFLEKLFDFSNLQLLMNKNVTIKSNFEVVISSKWLRPWQNEFFNYELIQLFKQINANVSKNIANH